MIKNFLFVYDFSFFLIRWRQANRCRLFSYLLYNVFKILRNNAWLLSHFSKNSIGFCLCFSDLAGCQMAALRCVRQVLTHVCCSFMPPAASARALCLPGRDLGHCIGSALCNAASLTLSLLPPVDYWGDTSNTVDIYGLQLVGMYAVKAAFCPCDRHSVLFKVVIWLVFLFWWALCFSLIVGDFVDVAFNEPTLIWSPSV